MARHQTVTPISSVVDRRVSISLTIDRRGMSSEIDAAKIQKFPIVVMVSYQSKKYYYRTGTKVTVDEYSRLLKSSVKGSTYEQKKIELEKFQSVVKKIASLLDDDNFSLVSLKEALTHRHKLSFTSLLSNRIEELKCAGQLKTAYVYNNLLNKMLMYYNHEIQFPEISVQFAVRFKEYLVADGLSTTTQSIYLRSFRAICNIALENGYIRQNQYPFSRKGNGVKIPQGKKRKDWFLPISDILMLKSYVETHHETATGYGRSLCEAVDMWLFSYLGNGINLTDMASLKYDSHYFRTKGEEFSFVRKKTMNSTADEIIIYIPIIGAMKEILTRIGAAPKPNEFVFPQILNYENDDSECMKLVAQYGSNIGARLANVSDSIGLSSHPTMTWARHSFKTNLIHKKVPDYYTEQAMGHSNNTVGDNYVGMFTHEDRVKYNSMLLEL